MALQHLGVKLMIPSSTDKLNFDCIYTIYMLMGALGRLPNTASRVSRLSTGG